MKEAMWVNNCGMGCVHPAAHLLWWKRVTASGGTSAGSRWSSRTSAGCKRDLSKIAGPQQPAGSRRSSRTSAGCKRDLSKMAGSQQAGTQ
ncbi:hypothetical protein DMENIID0001_083150 [Sergentomyia squamirostris]